VLNKGHENASSCKFVFGVNLAVSVSELPFGDAGLGYRNTPSSLLMAALLLEIRGELEGRTVLELGAGLGLPGMLASSLGAEQVVLTDYHPRLLKHLVSAANEHTAQQHNPKEIQVASLDWLTATGWDGAPDLSRYGGRDAAAETVGADAATNAGASSMATADDENETVRSLDPSAKFDILLGIDVVYEPELVRCLPKVVKQHLRARLTPAAAAHDSRGGGDGNAAVVAVAEDQSNGAGPWAAAAAVEADRLRPADPGWLSSTPGEPSPCAYFVCPAREPSTIALFINSCVAEGLAVRVTPLGTSSGGRDLSYLAGPLTGGPLPPPTYPTPPTDACLLVRCWIY
jgi:predicted nicotinamide N-methyase